MRLSALGFMLLLMAAPALACVCSQPETEAEKREYAALIARQMIAVVDVEQTAGMDYDGMRGETYRVVAQHVGKAPTTFELDRGFQRQPDGSVGMAATSCDEIPPAGKRTTVALYDTETPGKLRFGGTCVHMFVNTPGAVDLIRAEAAKLARPVERG